MKDGGETPCPVTIKFTFNKQYNRFRRVSKMVMHHSHKLELKNTHQTLSKSHKKIYEEMKVFVQCDIPKQQVLQILREKYSMPMISFTQVMRLWCQVKSDLRKESLPIEHLLDDSSD